MKPRAIVVAAALLLGILAGIGTGLHAQGLEYPPLYKSLALPELPRSRVLSSGHESASLRDGLTIRVSVLMHVNEVQRFYNDSLTKAGWSVTATKPMLPGVQIANVHAMKSRMTFTAAITSSGSGATQVTLNVTER